MRYHNAECSVTDNSPLEASLLDTKMRVMQVGEMTFGDDWHLATWVELIFSVTFKMAQIWYSTVITGS